MKSFVKVFLILFTIVSAFVLINPFGTHSFNPSTIISKHNWHEFATKRDKKILAQQKIQGEFTATNNRLGIVEIKFNVYYETIPDTLIFRIKEKGDTDWFYQSKHNNIAHTQAFFPFGFPVISDSKNKTYVFELESAFGNDEKFLSLSSQSPFFLTKYSFPLNYLKQNKTEISSFALAKGVSIITALTTVPISNYLFIILVSFLIPIIISKSHPVNITDQTIFLDFFNNFWFLVVSIFISLFFTSNSERLEWTLYEISAVGIVLISYIFNRFLKLKISSTIFKRLLNFYVVSFACFALLLLLSKNIMPRHLIFLLLAFIPLIKTFTNSLQVLLINLIGIFSILAYFNIDFKGYSFTTLGIIIGITAIIYFSFQIKRKFNRINFKLPSLVYLIISFFIILYLSQGPISYHHYSFYVGPALDVIKGKSLLGDTPSQYGYLSIHFLAFILNLIGISLAKFNLINILLFVFNYILAGIILFKLIKNKFLAVISSFVFITLQTLFSQYSGSLYPSTGPLRFGLGLLMLWVILSFPQKINLILASIIASVALFWSIETAIYVIPAWLITCLITSYYSENSFKKFFKSILLKFSFFGISTAILFSIIVFKEYFHFQAFPRILDYLEFANIYKGGFGALPIPVYGNYYLLIIIMILGIVTSSYLLTQKVKIKFLPLLVFISIHNVAIFSYFISRSHENNIVNITGFYILQLVIIIKIITKVFKISSEQLKKTIALPLILFIVLYFIRIFNQTANNYKLINKNFSENIFEWITPETQTPTLSKALVKYHLENRPVVVLSQTDDTRLLVESGIKNELPLNPAFMTYVLYSSWRVKYIDPVLAKLKAGTVVIVDKYISDSFLQSVFADIQTAYNLKKIGTIDSDNLEIYQIVAKF